MKNTLNILSEVHNERNRQDDKWGGAEHDDKHSIAEFVQLIKDYSGWARVMGNMGSILKARKRLIQVAALAVATIEAIDRNFSSIPSLGRVAYNQGISIEKNPFNPETESELFNKWIVDWNYEKDGIPF